MTSMPALGGILAATVLLATGCQASTSGEVGEPEAAAALDSAGRTALLAQPMSLDGSFDDWAGLAPVATDPEGDMRSGGLDLGRFWVTDRGGALWLRVEIGREANLQHTDPERMGAELTLYIDGDGEPGTGLPIGGIGADVAVQLGRLRALRFGPEGFDEATLNELAIGVMPTHTADTFEMRIPLAAPRAGAKVGLVVRTEGGDRLPDGGHVAYEISGESDPAPEPIPFERLDSGHVRLLVHNTERTGIVEHPEPFERYLRALDPDIIAFQEAWDWSVDRAVLFLSRVLPPPDRTRWHGAQHEDIVTLSRWPIAAHAPVGGNLVARIDLPDETGPRDLVLFNVHTPCCDQDDDRDTEHQRLAATWRDLLAGQGPFEIDPSSPGILTGDFNMVGLEHQLTVVRDGELLDPAQFGESFRPGRARGSLIAVPSRHTHTRETYTWRHDRQSFLSGRLDWIFFSDDTARLGRHFVLWTPEIPDDVLDAHGLLPDDSPRAADHLVMVADFDLR